MRIQLIQELPVKENQQGCQVHRSDRHKKGMNQRVEEAWEQSSSCIFELEPLFPLAVSFLSRKAKEDLRIGSEPSIRRKHAEIKERKRTERRRMNDMEMRKEKDCIQMREKVKR